MNQAVPGQGGAKPPAATTPEAGAADPSMEDILASIRRILSDDEQASAAAAPPMPEPEPPPHPSRDDDVLPLSEAMLVEPAPDEPPAEPAQTAAPQMPEPAPEPTPEPFLAAPEPLVAPATAAAAAGSVSALLRSFVQEREQLSVYRGGPTIEDLVREEIRPLLKQWLDENLPPMVERLVRAELERVLGRVIP